MSITGTKIGIIGGSIAGCAAAAALSRAGCDVAVFERSSKGLRDRGSGIAIPGPLRATLMDKAYLPKGFPTCEMTQRFWMFPDGTRDGRNLWTQPTPAFANNWGNLWSALRRLVPDEIYHKAKQFSRFEQHTDGVEVSFTDGTTSHVDLLVGADGYNSRVRMAMHPKAAPEYAGYILWRGNFHESVVKNRDLIEKIDTDGAWLTMPFPGGHGVLYMIPNFDGTNTTGGRRVNWAIYGLCPKALRLNGVETVAPGAVTEDVFAELQDLLATHFPPSSRDLVAHSKRQDISIQPIYDCVVESYVTDRVLLIGDAGTIPRPHTASGATKALEDAVALETIATDAKDIPDLLERYNAERCAVAQTLSGIGRRIGQAQVLNTPNWAAMKPVDFEAWIKQTLSGEKLYLYGNDG